MNLFDSQRLAGSLEALGYAPATGAAEADLILLNTCSVREKAAHKLFSRLGALKVLKRENPKLIVGVAGCVAQQEKERILTRAPVVDFVIGTRAAESLPRILMRVGEGRRAVDFSMPDSRYDEVRPLLPGHGRRAFVTVIEGCNKACSFCIVPLTRGAEMSRPPEQILSDVQRLVAGGTLEIELLGQNVNAYRYGDVTFAALLRMLDRVPGLERLRFRTSHPREFTDDVIVAMAELRTVCNHLHLPVQSGSNAVLKRMYRGYDRERYLSRIRSLRSRVQDVAISTDIIVGFPGETEDEFMDTMRLVDEVVFDQVYAFLYSPRPHTRAAELADVVPIPEKETRLQRLLARQDQHMLAQHRALVGRTLEVLVEGPAKRDTESYTGRTTDNRIVNFSSGGSLLDGLVHVHVTGAHPHSLVGEVVRTEAAIA